MRRHDPVKMESIRNLTDSSQAEAEGNDLQRKQEAKTGEQ